jgi:uncharacterized membrane protein YphA (DoxX/SURF4 family)
MTIIKRTTLTEAISLLLIILFLYTGISKLWDYPVFKEQIGTSPLLVPLAPFVAGSLPWIEFIVVLMLIIPRWKLKGLYAAMGLLLLFTCYIIAILIFNKNIPCSCGGVIESLSWNQHIVFNSLFILLAGIGIVLEKREKQESKKILLQQF